MAYDIIQSASNIVNAGGTTSISVSLTPTPGNRLVLVCAINSPNPPATISFPSGFVTDEEIVNGGGPGVLSIASRVVPASPASSWACSFTGSSAVGIAAIELPPGVPDANASIREVSSLMNIPSITPTDGKDAILLACVLYGAGYGVTSVTGGYSGFVDQFLSGDSKRFWVGKRLVNPTSGSYSGTYAAQGNGVVAETIQAAYTATPPTVRSMGMIV